MASRKAGEKLSSYRQSFEDNAAKWSCASDEEGGREEIHGRWCMEEDISKYNIKDGWSAKLDRTDLKRLRKPDIATSKSDPGRRVWVITR